MTDRTTYHTILGRRVYLARPQRAERGDPGPVSLAFLLTVIGLAVTAFHELTYRQTGGDEFPVLHVVSHAGGDMLMLLGVLVLVAMLAPRIAQRGLR